MSTNFRWKGTSPLTTVGIRKRVFLLPHSEGHVILSPFIWIGYQRVTDRQTDRQTDIQTDRQTDGRTDGWTELPWLIQRSALQAMKANNNINAMFFSHRFKCKV